MPWRTEVRQKRARKHCLLAKRRWRRGGRRHRPMPQLKSRSVAIRSEWVWSRLRSKVVAVVVAGGDGGDVVVVVI